jgi:hypothetical protein
MEVLEAEWKAREAERAAEVDRWRATQAALEKKARQVDISPSASRPRSVEGHVGRGSLKRIKL